MMGSQFCSTRNWLHERKCIKLRMVLPCYTLTRISWATLEMCYVAGTTGAASCLRAGFWIAIYMCAYIYLRSLEFSTILPHHGSRMDYCVTVSAARSWLSRVFAIIVYIHRSATIVSSADMSWINIILQIWSKVLLKICWCTPCPI